MSSRVRVLLTEGIPSYLPDCAKPGASLFLHFDKEDLFTEAAERVRVNRQGGYTGFDALLFLLLFFVNPTYRSIRAFSERISAFSTSIAALAGRSRLLSRSSLSRLLGRVSMEEVLAFRSWLLLDFSNAFELLKRPDTQHQDRLGQAWHVVDFDPTLQGVRQRNLPHGPDLPDPIRRLSKIASKGHLGRKRGQIGIRTTPLLHPAAGVWLNADLGSGPGVHSAQFESSVRVTSELQQRLGGDAGPRFLLRADGEFGTVRSYTCCREHGIALITRTARYGLLDEVAVIERMKEGDWQRVPDSGSGPTRWALDLGLVEFQAKKGIERSDGRAFEPVRARVIVSRTQIETDKHGCGQQLEQQNFELFVAVDVPSDAFSAADVVFLFYGRVGQENYFSLLKRQELLGRSHCNKAPGQLFASLVALAVWNAQVAQSSAVSGDVSPRILLEPQTTDDAPPLPASMMSLVSEPAEEVVLPPLADSSDEDKPLSSAEMSRLEKQAKQQHDEMEQFIAELPWPRLLARRHGWQWLADERCVQTDDGRLLYYTRIEPTRRTAKVRLKSNYSSRQQVTIALKPEEGKRAMELYAACKEFKAAAAASRRPILPKSRKPFSPPRRTRLIESAVDGSASCPSPVELPSFLPVTAMRQRQFLVDQLQICVQLSPPRRKSPPSRPVTRFTRQHRRLTWTERMQYAALDEATSVTARILGTREELVAMA